MTSTEMETRKHKMLKSQHEVSLYSAHLAQQKGQPCEKRGAQNAENIPNLQPRKEKIETETDPPVDSQIQPEAKQTSIEETRTPNKTPTEEVHASIESYRRFGSVAKEIESLRAARMWAIAEIKKSIMARSNGPRDVQAEEFASRTALETCARSMEELMSDNKTDEGKDRRIEVIAIDSDEEEHDDMPNIKRLPVPSQDGSYGKLFAENMLKKLKEQDLLKGNGNSWTGINNYKGKEVAVDVSPMNTLCEDRAHDTKTNNCTKEVDVGGTNNLEFAEDVNMVDMRGTINLELADDVNIVKDESLNNSSDVEADGSYDFCELPGDDFEECWRDMDLAMEMTKEYEGQEGAAAHIEKQDPCEEDDGEEEVCVHDCKLDEQHGLVCRICGLIEKKIDTIFEYQWHKPSRSIKTYPVGSRSQKYSNADRPTMLVDVFHGDITSADMVIHPRHSRHMRPHQFEGFNFLVRNLTGDNPGGCILAHAPGSGKTFMLISFIQSFLGRYPTLRPLIVLPKGIVPTWRNEFKNWQIEDIPLYDFYSCKADTRSQQLEVLNFWEGNKSVLLLGYQQFASIVTDDSNDNSVRQCQNKLLNVPGLLILDEGHTPRNDETNCLNSLAKVQTVRKVVLSGTLFQNHVKEVFNIVNLIRPRFLVSEHARPIVRRIMSQVNMSSRRNTNSFSEALFCELVEETLKQEKSSSTKIDVIKGLRKLTENILHYYKGDLLDDLPGLCDFTVMLKLTPRQKQIVKTICRSNSVFKRNSSCALVSVHPSLEEMTDDKIETSLKSLDISEGVKATFMMNLLSLAVSNNEKVLVFGRYLRSLKFLEKLVTSTKGWVLNKEVFRITGSTSQNDREWATERFNNSKDAKILFGSVKACGEGISLVGASRLVILDQHANPSVTRQVVGRAFRPGQVKKVFCYRLVACKSPEEEEHATSLCKEVVSKMWFEWRANELCHYRFGLDEVNFNNCGDIFFESAGLRQDVHVLYKR